MNIEEILEPAARAQICERVLRSLPKWFGIESATAAYIKDVETMRTWAAYAKSELAGFVSINLHFPTAAEIHVMGVRPEFHRQGVGQSLMLTVEASLREAKVKFLTVKTLSESRVNREYALTRAFYLSQGFVPIEEFKTLWGDANPCLLLAKSIES